MLPVCWFSLGTLFGATVTVAAIRMTNNEPKRIRLVLHQEDLDQVVQVPATSLGMPVSVCVL